ncbi:MAG: EAL domain-containing protein [Chlamydiae bacterium]|nr:EAL domain-containing protein [Chlamydiota bacterium]MBI3277291.1 EAL domain-containing protein [Chlamydiota bacterium]
MLEESYSESVGDDVHPFEKSLTQIENALAKGAPVGLVYLDASKFWAVEEHQGWEFVDKLFRETAKCLLTLKEKVPSFLEVLPTSRIWRDDFIVFFVSRAKTCLQWTEGLLTRMSDIVREQLTQHFKNYPGIQNGDMLQFFLGWSSITPVKGLPLGGLIGRAIREAIDFAAEQRFSKVPHLASELKKLIDNGEMTTVFQPVIYLASKTILGYEALARGPEGTVFKDPETIFRIASQGRFLMKAERLAKISAMESAYLIPNQYKIFLNIESELLIRPDEIFKMLREVGCTSGRIVFEITERKAVKDFEQLQTMIKLMKEEGYQFAIDDAGSGYASMESIAILDPHYIKIDQSIIRGIESNHVKQDVVRAFINLVKSRQGTLIAEGVETQGEADILTSLGVDCAQGFFFAHPAFPPPMWEEKTIKN